MAPWLASWRQLMHDPSYSMRRTPKPDDVYVHPIRPHVRTPYQAPYSGLQSYHGARFFYLSLCSGARASRGQGVVIATAVQERYGESVYLLEQRCKLAHQLGVDWQAVAVRFCASLQRSAVRREVLLAFVAEGHGRALHALPVGPLFASEGVGPFAIAEEPALTRYTSAVCVVELAARAGLADCRAEQETHTCVHAEVR